MSIWRWLIGDTDEPLGPESERGLFNHFNRPESLPWPPDHPDYVGDRDEVPRPKQFRVSDLCPESLPPTATGKAVLVDGEYKPTFRDEPRELKPTVGYYNSPPPRDYPNAPTIPVPYAVRPAEVTEALKIGDTHPDVYEYIVHLESHFARTHHHGK